MATLAMTESSRGRAPRAPRILAYCCATGTVATIVVQGGGAPLAWWLTGALLAGALVPFFLFGPGPSLIRWIGVGLALITVTSLGTWTESLIFLHSSPGIVTELLGSLLLTIAVGTSAVVAARWLGQVSAGGIAPRLRPRAQSVLAVLLAGLGYLVYYYVFGAIAFRFTSPWYSDAHSGMRDAQTVVLALGWWFPLIQIGRGMLMTMGVLPMIATLRLPRHSAAIIVGLVLWVLGGLAPLIPPNGFMPAELRFYHIVEVFAQNFALGVTAVLLLRRRD